MHLFRLLSICFAALLHGAEANTKVPAVVHELISMPSALPAALSDKLAEEAKAVVQADGRGQLPVDFETAELFVSLGLTTTTVSEVNIRIETDEDRWGTHSDSALPGTPPDYKHTAIIYLSGCEGGLQFPTFLLSNLEHVSPFYKRRADCVSRWVGARRCRCWTAYHARTVFRQNVSLATIFSVFARVQPLVRLFSYIYILLARTLG